MGTAQAIARPILRSLLFTDPLFTDLRPVAVAFRTLSARVYHNLVCRSFAVRSAAGEERESPVSRKGAKTQRKTKKKLIHFFLWLLRGESLAESFSVVVAVLGDFGFQKAAMAAAFSLDFFGLENEPGRGADRCRIVWFAQHFVQVVQSDGGVEIGLAGGDALGFHVLQGFGGGGQDSVETLLVHGEIHEGLGVLEPLFEGA
jgi:hypothetical protein